MTRFLVPLSTLWRQEAPMLLAARTQSSLCAYCIIPCMHACGRRPRPWCTIGLEHTLLVPSHTWKEQKKFRDAWTDNHW